MISVIVCAHNLENRGYDRLRLSLYSLSVQSFPVGVIVADSSTKGAHIVSGIAQEYGARYLSVDTGGIFNICKLMNTGCRVAIAEQNAEYLHCTGADFVYAPFYFEHLTKHLTPGRFFLSPVYMAHPDAGITQESIDTWPGWKLHHDWGAQAPGLQTFHRDWFTLSQGYDENMSGWGGMDEDMILRAKRHFAKVEFVPFRAVYHVWHPPFKKTGQGNEAQQKRNWAYRDKWRHSGPLNWKLRN